MYGRKSGDWGVHSLGHVLSVLYDVPHGASLSVVYPAWMKHFREQASDRIIELGKNLFNVGTVDETIFEMENLFHGLESPTRLTDVGIGTDKHEEIYETMVFNEVSGAHFKMEDADYRAIIALMAG